LAYTRTFWKIGSGVAPLPPGYTPGGNRILIAGYKPAQEIVNERSLCAHPVFF